MMTRYAAGLCLLVLTSCGGSFLLNETQEIAGGQWAFGDTKQFTVQTTDTLTPQNFYLIIRHGGDYAYQNMIVIVKTYFPNNTFVSDTIDCPLADAAGNWYGSGLGDLHDNQVMFKRNVQMPMSGGYKFELQHAMRSDTVRSVYDVGIAIENARE